MKKKKSLIVIKDFLAIETGDLSDFIKLNTSKQLSDASFDVTKNLILNELFNINDNEEGEESKGVGESQEEVETKKEVDAIVYRYILKTFDIEDYYTLLPVIRDTVIESSLHIKDDTFYLKITLSEKESILEAYEQVIGLPAQSRLLTENAYDLIK